MAELSPKPWTYQENIDYNPEGEKFGDGYTILAGEEYIATDVYGEANARFIATAPETMEALERLLQLMGEIDATTYVDDNGEDAFYPAVHAAYEAITKAKESDDQTRARFEMGTDLT